MKSLLIHSGKHPFQPFDYRMGYRRAMEILGLNSGNVLFAESMFKYVFADPDQKIDIDAYRFPLDDPEMDPELINEKYDAVVFPAANWLADYYAPVLPRYAAKIRALKIPCLVVGLGAQSSGDGSFGFLNRFAAEAKDFLSAVSDKSHSISVRGEFSGACLGSLGFRNVSITGCPSFYRNLDAFAVTKRQTDPQRFRLAINSNANLIGRSSDLLKRENAFLFSQGDIFHVMAERWQTPWDELKKVLGDGTSMDLIMDGRVRFYGDATPWIRELQEFDFSLGTRIHGNIMALLAGTPAAVVTHDSRTGEMARFYDIPTLSLDALRKGLDPWDAFLEADYGPMQKNYPARLANMAAFMDDNGFRHTLRETNGKTPFDQRIATLDYSNASARIPGGLFFMLGRAFSRVRTKLRPVNS